MQPSKTLYTVRSHACFFYCAVGFFYLTRKKKSPCAGVRELSHDGHLSLGASLAMVRKLGLRQFGVRALLKKARKVAGLSV
jgi:hypothetical protein